jgi:hypothetical protein
MIGQFARQLCPELISQLGSSTRFFGQSIERVAWLT